uniref:Uncharacterized protein n=1 Tax=Oryza meridionalis TaxID=40149 RepID=A0A0E0ELX3_9ORYZ
MEVAMDNGQKAIASCTNAATVPRARTLARAGAAVRRPEQRPDDDMIWVAAWTATGGHVVSHR